MAVRRKPATCTVTWYRRRGGHRNYQEHQHEPQFPHQMKPLNPHHYHCSKTLSWRTFTPPAPLRLAARYDVILAFGDSVMEQFIASSSSTSRIRFGDKVALPLLTHTVPALLDALEQSLGPHLHNHDDGDDQNVALILNSALWNVLSDEATIPSSTGPAASSSLSKDYVNDAWDNHVQALTEFLTQVLQRYGSGAPSSEASPPQRRNRVTVYWLLPTAVHIHRVHVADSDAMRQRAPQKINRTRYLSASRTRQLYQRQKQVVQAILARQRPIHDETVKAGFLIDVFEATYLSADWTLPGDGRHYRPELNQRMLSWCL
jgi:hypothetical protein